MIDEALVFLKNQLNAHLRAQSKGALPDDYVVFVDGDKMDPITFKLGAVSILVINVEEERTMRPADRHARVDAGGTRQSIHPDIRLNLGILFVARFKQYEQSWRYLSAIIAYFQAHPVMARADFPALAEAIGRLHMELATLQLSQQNEVWSSLRTTYLPSVMYRAGLCVLRDAKAVSKPLIQETHIEVIR